MENIITVKNREGVIFEAVQITKDNKENLLNWVKYKPNLKIMLEEGCDLIEGDYGLDVVKKENIK